MDAKRAQKWLVRALAALALLTLINLSYLSNSGLLIFNLRRAARVDYRNAHLHGDTARSKSDPLVLSRFSMEPLLSEEDSAAVAARIKALKPHWNRRNPAMSTLGTASYLDGAAKTDYERLAASSNPLMQEHFGDLLDAVLQYFQKRCPGATVRYRPQAALPGFHVFHCNKLFSMPVASVHKDMQWNRLRYARGERIDTANTLSFTLALELPPGGGGLYTFEGKEMPGLLSYIVPKALMYNAAKKTKIDYKAGWMVTHNGQTYHMIAPSPASDGDVYRITLQGHGVYDAAANTWWLYW